MGLVGAVSGGVGGAIGGAAKGAWRGLTTGDPFHGQESFMDGMKNFMSMLSQLPLEQQTQFKRQFCQTVMQV